MCWEAYCFEFWVESTALCAVECITALYAEECADLCAMVTMGTAPIKALHCVFVCDRECTALCARECTALRAKECTALFTGECIAAFCDGEVYVCMCKGVYCCMC